MTIDKLARIAERGDIAPLMRHLQRMGIDPVQDVREELSRQLHSIGLKSVRTADGMLFAISMMYHAMGEDGARDWCGELRSVLERAERKVTGLWEPSKQNAYVVVRTWMEQEWRGGSDAPRYELTFSREIAMGIHDRIDAAVEDWESRGFDCAELTSWRDDTWTYIKPSGSRDGVAYRAPLHEVTVTGRDLWPISFW